MVYKAAIWGKTNDPNRTILTKHCLVKIEDIVEEKVRCALVPSDANVAPVHIQFVSQWMSTAFDPAHYIVLHHADKSVVFAIRGTLHLHDIASDRKRRTTQLFPRACFVGNGLKFRSFRYDVVTAKMLKFENGMVHDGVFRCAQNKVNKVIPLVKATLEKHPDYKLVIVGHSLGFCFDHNRFSFVLETMRSRQALVSPQLLRRCSLKNQSCCLRIKVWFISFCLFVITSFAEVECFAYAVPAVFSSIVSRGPYSQQIEIDASVVYNVVF